MSARRAISIGGAAERRSYSPALEAVIPGPREARSPEPINTELPHEAEAVVRVRLRRRLWVSGFTPAACPGMTLGGSEPHRPGPLHLRDRLDLVQQLGRDRLVDGDEADRVASLPVAAEREGRDVDAGLAEQRPEGADEAGLVGIAHVEHVRRELGVDGDVADLGHPRLAVLEHGAAG